MNCKTFTHFVLYIETHFLLTIWQNHAVSTAAVPVVECDSKLLDLNDLCPSQSIRSRSENSENLCLSSDARITCPQARIFGVSFDNNTLLTDREKKLSKDVRTSSLCTHYHLLTQTVLDQIFTKVCPHNVSFMQVAFEFQSEFSNECSLSIQQYNLSSPNCNSLFRIDALRDFPYCIEYKNCSSKLKYNLIQKLSLVDVFSRRESSEELTQSEEEFQKFVEIPQPLPSKSKQSEVRKMERPEVIRRVKKSVPWSWRDHVLEFTISLICSAIILLVALKICLAEKFIDAYQSARILPPVKQHLNRHHRLSEMLSSPHKKRLGSDYSKYPSKPILKNNSTGKSFSSLTKLRDAEFQSFESNSSIYFDAVEGFDSFSHSQPLISPC